MHHLLITIMIVSCAAAFWPRHGLLARCYRLRQLTEKACMEHVLKHLHHCEYSGLTATLESLAGTAGISRNRTVVILSGLEAAGLVRMIEGRPRLTAAGRREALRVIRIHRLWERYFADHSGLDETLWHEEADRREHVTSEEELERLAARVGNLRFDPHGAPIPTSGGELPAARGEPLTGLAPGEGGRVVHVEDEPQALYEQLVAQGLRVGAVVRVLERNGQRTRLEVAGEEQVVASVAAGNVSIERIDSSLAPPGISERLCHLQLGEGARVVGLLPSCHGVQRRRLLDLGLVGGTVIQAELRSAAGDPTAYRIRGALVALRESQARHVAIARLEGV